MSRSVLTTDLSYKAPIITTAIPTAGSPNGLPFCLKYAGELTQWQIVRDGCDYGYDLPLDWVTNTGSYIYYNGTQDILAYLQGEGYDVGAGRWYYTWRLDGVNTGEDRLDAFGGSALGYTASAKAYGEWTIDLDYTIGSAPAYYLTSNANDFRYATELLSFTMSSNLCTFSSTGVSAVDKIYFDPLNYFPDSGRYTLRFVKNSYTDEFVVGAVGTSSMYVNGQIVTDEQYYGLTYFIDNTITSCTYINIVQTKTSPTSGIYSFDEIPLVDFVATFGSFDITVQNEGITGGTIQHSQPFELLDEDLHPQTPGDYSALDYSIDYNI